MDFVQEGFMAETSFYGQNTIQVVEELVEECDAFLGCVAWCTHPNLLLKMEGKNLGLVINNTSYGNEWHEKFLERKYSAMSYRSDHPIVFKGFDDTKLLQEWPRKLPSLGQVLKVGEPHSFTANERTRMMHCKFLVFGKMERISRYFSTPNGHWNDKYGIYEGDLEAFVPYACWVGSCNLTAASTENDECGVLIKSQDVAFQAMGNWFELYMQKSTFSHPQ